MTTAAAQLSAGNVRQSQTTLNEALPLYKAMVTKNARKEQEHGKLSVVHLIVIIGKVLAPLVGAIIEPLLVNIAKGITWAITYSLATGKYCNTKDYGASVQSSLRFVQKKERCARRCEILTG